MVFGDPPIVFLWWILLIIMFLSFGKTKLWWWQKIVSNWKPLIRFWCNLLKYSATVADFGDVWHWPLYCSRSDKTKVVRSCLQDKGLSTSELNCYSESGRMQHHVRHLQNDDGDIVDLCVCWLHEAVGLTNDRANSSRLLASTANICHELSAKMMKYSGSAATEQLNDDDDDDDVEVMIRSSLSPRRRPGWCVSI